MQTGGKLMSWYAMFSTDGRVVLLLMHFYFCSTLLNFVADAQGSKVERKCKQSTGESTLFHISATAARLNKASASLLVNFSVFVVVYRIFMWTCMSLVLVTKS